MSLPGGSESVRIRAEMQDEVSRRAAVIAESLDQDDDAAERLGRQYEKLEVQAKLVGAAQENLARKNAALAAAMRGNDPEALTRAYYQQSSAVRELETRKKEFVKAERESGKETRNTWIQNNKLLGSLIRLRSEFPKGARELDKFAKKLFSFGTFFKILKWGVILGGIRMLIVGITALGAAAYAAVAGMTPMIGAIVAMPGVMMAAGQAMAVMKLSIQGVGKAVSDMSQLHPDFQAINQDMQDMAPAAVTAANYLGAFMRGPFRDFRHGLQQAFFTQLNQGLGVLPQLLSSVSGPLKETATILGGIVSRLLVFLAHSSDLSSILDFNNTIITKLGNAFQSFIAFFLHFMVLAQPFLSWMGRGLELGAHHMDQWVHSAKGASEIATFFDHARHVMHMTWEIIKNITVALVATGKASHSMSSMMGSGLLDLTRKWRDFATSARGQNEMREFFKSMIPIMHDMAQGVGIIAKGFGQILKGGISGSFVQSILQLVKALLNLFNVLTQAGVIGTFSNYIFIAAKAVNALAAVFKVLGPVGTKVVMTILLIGIAMEKFLRLRKLIMESELVGLLRREAETWGSLEFAQRMANVQSAITVKWDKIKTAVSEAYGKVVRWVRDQIKLSVIQEKIKVVWDGISTKTTRAWAATTEFLGKLFKLSTYQMVAQTIAEKAKAVWDAIVTGTTRAWAAAQAWLTAELDANPIGAVILAIAALTVAIIELVKHWKAVVKWLQGPWGTAISAAIAVFMPWLGIPMLIIGHWKMVWGFMKNLWHWMVDAWNWLYKFVLKPVGIFFAVTMIGPVLLAVKGLQKAAGAIKTAWGWLWDHIFKPIGDFFKFTIIGPIHAVGKAFTALADIIKIGLGWVYEHIIKPIAEVVERIISGVHKAESLKAVGGTGKTTPVVGGGPGSTTKSGLSGALSGFIHGGPIGAVGGFLGKDYGWFGPAGGLIHHLFGSGNFGDLLQRAEQAYSKQRLPQQSVPGAKNTAPNVIGSPGNSTRPPWLPGRWAGGPVIQNMPYKVGEKGPELYKSDKHLKLVGLKGAEVMAFPKSGWIVPNNVLKAMAAKPAPSVKMRSASVSRAARSIPAQSQSTTVQVAGDTLNIHVDNAKEDWPQLEYRIKRLWTRLEREKRERMIYHAGNPRPRARGA